MIWKKDFGQQSDIVSSAQASLKHLENGRTRLRVKTPMQEAEDLLYMHGEREKAIEIYQKVIDSDSESPEAESAQLMIGVIYGYINQPEKEIEAFKKAVARYPGAVSHKHLGEAYEKQRMYKEVLEQIKSQ